MYIISEKKRKRLTLLQKIEKSGQRLNECKVYLSLKHYIKKQCFIKEDAKRIQINHNAFNDPIKVNIC